MRKKNEINGKDSKKNVKPLGSRDRMEHNNEFIQIIL